MSTQMPLPFTDSIQQRFERFHAENPQVYAILVRLVREWRAAGHYHGAIGMFWEVCRWQIAMQTRRGADDFKLNDHYRSRYARLIMATEPDLAGIFEVRRLRA